MRWYVAAGYSTGLSPVCGGTGYIDTQISQIEGLSPRVRGNLTAAAIRGLLARSIPACAGEPQASIDKYRLKTVYPRVCGGTTSRTAAGSAAPGLSPRVRGNRQHDILGAYPARSIPACAGEPLLRHRERLQDAVYPRVCGGTKVPVARASAG